MGHKIRLHRRPRRIVSLVPSQTELLFHLGLDEEIVGITRFCVRPAKKCKQKTIVGGTKQFNFEIVDRLQPDLILGNKEENYEVGIARLRQQYPVWLSDVITLQDACEMIAAIGAMVGKEQKAQQLVDDVQSGMAALPDWPALRAAYLIWRRPFMAAGHKTFAHEMLNRCGFVNVFGQLPRYPELTAAQILEANPDVLLLPSEPFPFSERHLPQFREQFPDVPAVLVDGQMFTWYGSRLLKAPAYFQALRSRLETRQAHRDVGHESAQGKNGTLQDTP